MLHAILSGKAGRVSVDGEADQSWREVFRKREDLLTAVFFSRIRYLSLEGERKVLALLGGQALVDKLGEIQEVIFWPKLRGKAGRLHVEPDVILVFDDALLMIEVKPPFGGGQRADQWRDQIESLILQRDEDGEIDLPETFHFLALGRNVPESRGVEEKLLLDFEADGLRSVQRREWDEICEGIAAFAKETDGRDAAIYADWIEAFNLFGIIEKPRPFSDLLKIACQFADDALYSLRMPPVHQEGAKLSDVGWRGLERFCRMIHFDEMKLWN